MSRKWLARQTGPADVHVLPLDDLTVHDHDDTCVCSPTPQLVPRGDDSDGWIYVHHSLDGRENAESHH